MAETNGHADGRVVRVIGPVVDVEFPPSQLPETELNGYIAEKTPFESWQEFLVAAYEHQATTDEIEALLDRDYQSA